MVVSEGLNVGDIGEVKDAFGHTSFGSSAATVAQIVTSYLNSLKLPVPGKARYQVPGTDQRNAAIYASTVDIEEAYRVGQKAALIAKDDGGGWMSTILRRPGDLYQVDYDKVPLEQVANSERAFPAGWITPDKTDVTDDFIRYARPLIGEDWPSVPLVNGLQRFARMRPIFVGKNLAEYIPQGYRV